MAGAGKRARGCKSRYGVLIFILLAMSMEPGENAYGSAIDFDVLAQVESSGNHRAVSTEGARGLFQLRRIAWQDVQNRFPRLRRYAYEEYVFDPDINRLFAEKYLYLLTRYLEHYGIEVTAENLCIAYSAGLSYLIHDKPLLVRTKRYIRRYKQLLAMAQ